MGTLPNRHQRTLNNLRIIDWVRTELTRVRHPPVVSLKVGTPLVPRGIVGGDLTPRGPTVDLPPYIWKLRRGLAEWLAELIQLTILFRCISRLIPRFPVQCERRRQVAEHIEPRPTWIAPLFVFLHPMSAIPLLLTSTIGAFAGVVQLIFARGCIPCAIGRSWVHEKLESTCEHPKGVPRKVPCTSLFPLPY